MDCNDRANFALACIGGGLTEKQTVDQILACNEQTQQHGLILNEQQALALAQARTEALKENRRIEFGGGMLDKLMMAVCDSPYVTQENYVDTLHEWIALFYELKNQTWDTISDDDLLDFLKKALNGCCHGSMELVADRAMRLAEHIHCGKKLDSFRLEDE